MKYAVISDVHGHAPALQLVIDDALAHGAEGFILCGDYCIDAPWPNECAAMLQALPNQHAIRGNNDTLYVIPGDDSGQFEMARWCQRTLQPEHCAWLESLPEEIAFTCEGVRVHVAHSSAAFFGNSFHAHFRSSTLPLRYPEGPVSRPQLLEDVHSTLHSDEAFQTRLQQLEGGVYIFGHNHIQCHAAFGNHLLINPGACGNPLDCGDHGAPYTLLSIESGRCTVEERRIPFDREVVIRQVMASDQYRCARVWSELVIAAWRTCREKVASFLRFCEEYARTIGDERRPFATSTWEAALPLWQQSLPHDHPELFV